MVVQCLGRVKDQIGVFKKEIIVLLHGLAMIGKYFQIIQDVVYKIGIFEIFDQILKKGIRYVDDRPFVLKIGEALFKKIHQVYAGGKLLDL
jgi:hypothetical protein